jgi:hypothetical protein
LFVCLFVCLFGWLVDLFVCLFVWSVWSVGRSVCLVGRSVGLVGRSVGRAVGRGRRLGRWWWCLQNITVDQMLKCFLPFMKPYSQQPATRPILIQ